MYSQTMALSSCVNMLPIESSPVCSVYCAVQEWLWPLVRRPRLDVQQGHMRQGPTHPLLLIHPLIGEAKQVIVAALPAAAAAAWSEKELPSMALRLGGCMHISVMI
jgi:hypothetical protein